MANVIESAFALLRDEIAPRAQAIDGDVGDMKWALGRLCQSGLMAMKRPDEYGGPGLTDEEFRPFQEEIARTSGALAFLQTQHQSAVGMIAKGDNLDLANDYLPRMHNGERLVGIGFSQLRRTGPPIMSAKPIDGGYLLNGVVPWVTGWSFYPEFLVGASLEDGRAVFGIAPLVTQLGVDVSAPMRLAAMEAAMTVSVTFKDFVLPCSRVVMHKPTGWIQRNDMINIALQGYFALGCAQAGLDVLARNAESKKLPFLVEAHAKLADELARCRKRTQEARQSASEETTDERLEVRAWAIELAMRCAQAAVVSSSGAANSAAHPAQRIYREALVFSVSAQTAQVMEATMARLVRP